MQKVGLPMAQIGSILRFKRSLLVASAVIVVGAGVIVSSALNVSAQSTTSRPTSADDLRPALATPDQIAQGKALAEASCVGCHGPNGVSTTPDVPHLASQRAAYLYAEMKAYQSGARTDAVMNTAVKFLNDEAFIQVSAYYASLDPAAAVAGAAAADKPDPAEAGKAAAAACAGCHGDTGISKTPGMPSLVGLDQKYLVTAMNAYKSGQRKNDLMKSMLANSSDVDVSNLALFYAMQKPAKAATPSVGDQAAGKDAAAGCSGCHGDFGVSSNPSTPSLAGQDTEYLGAALRAYKAGARNDETMKGLAATIDDATMKNMSAYYANQQPQQPTVRKPLTTKEWAARCDRCHGIDGNSVEVRIPALAGQRVEYLAKALREYRSHDVRKSPEMVAMSEVLTDSDIDNLAQHYAQQRTRAVVYVPLSVPAAK